MGNGFDYKYFVDIIKKKLNNYYNIIIYSYSKIMYIVPVNVIIITFSMIIF